MTKWVSISDIADREALHHHAEQAAADIAALETENEQLRAKLADIGLTLATLCDMVLGEDAEDRGDEALIRAVGRLRGELSAVDEALGEFYCPVRDPDTDEPCGSFYKDHGVSIAMEELRKAQQEAAWLRRQNEWLNSSLGAALCRLQDLQSAAGEGVDDGR